MRMARVMQRGQQRAQPTGARMTSHTDASNMASVRPECKRTEIASIASVGCAMQSAASSASAYSSATVQSSSSAPAPEVVTAKQPMLAYVFRDTVFVRDTVIVRDTVFIPSPCAPDSLQRKTQTSR